MKRNGIEKLRASWQAFLQKEEVQKLLPFLQRAAKVLSLTGKWAYQLRSVLLAIPVAVCAGTLAIRNARLLPQSVGVNMLSSGTYQWMVSRELAVLIPFLVTAVCLALMFCSKKVLYPWLISVFSLILPMVIWITNVFPS